MYYIRTIAVTLWGQCILLFFMLPWRSNESDCRLPDLRMRFWNIIKNTKLYKVIITSIIGTWVMVDIIDML